MKGTSRRSFLDGFRTQANQCQHVHKLRQGLGFPTFLDRKASPVVLPIQQILQSLMESRRTL